MNESLRVRALEWLRNKKGSSSLMNLVITLAIGIILIAFLIPVAINQFVDANTTTWNAEWISLWNVIPIFVFLGIVIAIIFLAVKRKF